MTHDPHAATNALYTQVEITASPGRPYTETTGSDGEQVRLLRDLLAAQDRQNELLEELLSVVGAPQRQRTADMNQWKQANPALAQHCKQAAEALVRVQTEFLHKLTGEVNENADCLADGEFMLNEFVDRFGPRLAHLNGVLQILTQLGSGPQGHPAV